MAVFAVAASYIAGTSSRMTLKCTGLNVCILDSLDNSFVSTADIKTFLDKGMGSLVGLPLDSIDLVKVENVINGKSAVLKSEAFVTKDGKLNINVTQRRPIVRFHKSNGGFYADAEGCLFPLQSSYASHVQVIDGHIPLKADAGHKGIIENPDERLWFERIMNLVNYIEGHRYWKDMIVQIHVNKDGDIVIVPRSGKEKFIFGQAVSVDEKFEKMNRYYTCIVPDKGVDRYREVDLRFDGRIICR